MKKNKKENVSTPKKSKMAGSVIGKFCQILGVITAIGLVAYFVLYLFAVVMPVKKVENTYEKQTKLLQEIINRTPPQEVLVTNADLKTMTDDDVFAVLAEVGDNADLLAELNGSFETFINDILVDYDTTITYEQLVSFSDYVRNYCGTSDLTSSRMTGAITDYMCNVAAVCFLDKATPAVKDLYDKHYDTYNKMEEHPEVESPLQLTGLVTQMVKDSTLQAKLLSSSTSINRTIQAEYSSLKADYKLTYGNNPNINGMFFDITAQSEYDLIDLRMIACSEFLVTGCYLPINISEADSLLIDEARETARKNLIACNKRFNMTVDGETVTGIEKFLQNFAVRSVNKVYDRIVDYNKLELGSYLHSPLQFTDAHIAKYNRDYVFWNMMLGMLTFEDSTSYGTLVANINNKLGTLDYGFINGGNTIFENSELDSLLWAQAEQHILAYVYENCKLAFDENGNVVAEDTNDELVAAYRNWFEAWNLWGSQYTQ